MYDTYIHVHVHVLRVNATSVELVCEPPTTPDSHKCLLCVKPIPDLLQEVYAGVMNIALHSLISDTSLSFTLLRKSPLEVTVLLSCYTMTLCGLKLCTAYFLEDDFYEYIHVHLYIYIYRYVTLQGAYNVHVCMSIRYLKL